MAVACDVYNGEETGDTAATVTSATGIANASGPKVMEGPCCSHHGQDSRVKDCGEVSPTLHSKMDNTSDVPLVGGPKVMAFDVQTNDGGDHKRKDRPHGGMYVKETDTSLTIGSTDSTKVVAWNGDTTPKASEDVSVTLRSQQGGEGVGVAHAHENDKGWDYLQQNLTVRRLTCRECERLQGFPDDWTLEKMELELEGNEWKATGKVVKQADGPRYRACGNAVTVNVAEWIGRRLKRLQATYTPEELEELGVGTTYPKTLGEYLREDRG